MNRVWFAAMALLVSSIRFARGWTANPSFRRKAVASLKPAVSSSTRLLSFNSLRWSEDEFKPLSASSRSYNATSIDANDQRDLISFDKILAECPQTENGHGMTYPGRLDMNEKMKIRMYQRKQRFLTFAGYEELVNKLHLDSAGHVVEPFVALSDTEHRRRSARED